MTLDRGLVARYLRQLADMGVEELYLDGMTAREALGMLAGRSASPPRTVAQPVAVAETRPAAPAPSAPEVRATSVAQGSPGAVPDALVQLGARAAGCTLCRLHETRTTVVFGEGNPTARVVVVGEAPGQEEDRTGRPFVGRAGRLLDLLLQTAGLPRDDVYICNVLKCRPPQNRDPQADEVAACTSTYLFGQLDAVAPDVLLAVGKFAAQSLLQSEESISRLRGRVHDYRGRPLIVTYHPAYLLRSPQMTRTAWEDLQLLRRVLDEQAGN